jgi:hypothetical protein
LRLHMANNDWRKAIALASKFPRLGPYKGDITRAHMAYTNPRFTVQLGMPVDELINHGIKALIAAYQK